MLFHVYTIIRPFQSKSGIMFFSIYFFVSMKNCWLFSKSCMCCSLVQQIYEWRQLNVATLFSTIDLVLVSLSTAYGVDVGVFQFLEKSITPLRQTLEKLSGESSSKILNLSCGQMSEYFSKQNVNAILFSDIRSSNSRCRFLMLSHLSHIVVVLASCQLACSK